MKEKLESLKTVTQRLEKELARAREKALTEREVDALFNRELELEQEYANDAISYEEARTEMGKIREMLKASAVFVETLPEYKALLGLLDNIDEDQKIRTLSHENAHGNMADQVGAEHKGYYLLAYKDGRGFGYRPWAEYAFKEHSSFDPEERSRLEEKIIRAPEEFDDAGKKLSSHDKKQLDSISKKRDTPR